MKDETFFNNLFMQEALQQAQIAYDMEEIPVGAIVVKRDSREIISRAHNLVEKNSNSLNHAEILAIDHACNILGKKNLQDYDIYVSLEPCTMCAAAISLAKIGRLFYGASDSKQGGIENGIRFFTSNSCFHRPEIFSGLSNEISAGLIKSFFSKIRKNSL